MPLTQDQKRQLIRIYRASATRLIEMQRGYSCVAIKRSAEEIDKSDATALLIYAEHFKPEGFEPNECWWYSIESEKEGYNCNEARIVALLLMVEIVKDM
jgi:hypothetical protein